jgi:peptide/nickel transport system ATP-binding protein
VSVSVRAGEILGLVGESGSGKTTLGLAMVGYVRRGLQISAGSVSLDGADLATLPESRLRGLRGRAMSYVPQDPATALNPSLRVGSQLRESLTYHGYTDDSARERVGQLLVEVGLDGVPNLADAYPHQLSGGQQQRVAIAIAFACRPSLIVLDEPTTGLDVSTQRTVLATVAELCSRYDVAAVYVSHDVAVVAQLVNNVGVMYSGRIVESGPASQVLQDPAHPYTRRLLRAVPSPGRAEQLVGIEGVPPRPSQRVAGCAFAPRCDVAVEACTVQQPELVPANNHVVAHLARCLRIGQMPPGSATSRLAPPATGDTSEDLVLTVRGLSAAYGSIQVVHAIDLEVPRGSCVAVVGESGSGKTTLARCIAGLHRGWTGRVELDGVAVSTASRGREPDQLRAIQYIFQSPYASLNPRRSVGGTVVQPLDHFAPGMRAGNDVAVLEALAAVSLPASLVAQYPDQLSGGERQRVAIARAIAVSPRLLICDEVTSALDVSVQASVVEMLRRLQQEQGLSLLFITHNLALVRSIAQHVVVLRDGGVVESGSVDDVLDRPRQAYTRRLLDDAPQFPVQSGH